MTKPKSGSKKPSTIKKTIKAVALPKKTEAKEQVKAPTAPKEVALSPEEKKVNQLKKLHKDGKIGAFEYNNNIQPLIERFDNGNREPALLEQILKA